MRLVDPETGKDAAKGQPGEVWLRGPSVFKGYVNNPKATAECMTTDGWLKTGDIAIIDDQGFVSIVDRLKELIKVSGFQCAPAELEGLLLSHPSIADVAVIGIDDEKTGEAPKAFVVLKPNVHASEQEIKDWLSKKVIGYKRLKAVEFVKEIHKSPSGKILRRLYRDQEKAKAKKAKL